MTATLTRPFISGGRDSASAVCDATSPAMRGATTGAASSAGAVVGGMGLDGSVTGALPVGARAAPPRTRTTSALRGGACGDCGQWVGVGV